MFAAKLRRDTVRRMGVFAKDNGEEEREEKSGKAGREEEVWSRKVLDELRAFA